MEYRGVHVASRQQVFHYGPVYGTNNIGEFLAIVHGLALLKQKGFDMPIYSDSVAIAHRLGWKQKKCKTKLPRDSKTEQLFLLIERAEKWLRENTYSTPILKWEAGGGEKYPRTSEENSRAEHPYPHDKTLAYTGDNVVMPLQKQPYPSTETSSHNPGPDSPGIRQPYRPQPATGGARSWKTRFCIRLSYIIHAPKRQNQRATVTLKRRDWDAPPLKTEDFNRC